MKKNNLLGRVLPSAVFCAAVTLGPAAWSAPPQTTKAPPHPRAIIVCWDGAKPSVLEDLLEKGQLPALKALMKDGCWTWTAQTIVPSSTLPSHVSMLAGVPPALHGVTWNSDRPEKGPLQVSTVFSVAKSRNLTTAMVVGKTKLRLLDAPGTVDADCLVEGTAEEVSQGALEIIGQFDPDLLFVHFAQPDAAGHESGWGDTSAGTAPSAEYLSALRACDAALGTLTRRLKAGRRWDRTLMILTADHGGHAKNHGSADPQDTTIPWIAAGPLVEARGPLKSPVHTEDTAATALAALGVALPGSWTGRPVTGVLRANAPRSSLKPAA